MEFVADALPVKMIKMNSAMMCNYIKFCANWLLPCLGCDHHFKSGNPFKWIETISLQGKTNFFEKSVGEYSKSGVGVDRADQTFARDASFWPPLSISYLMLHVTYFLFHLEHTNPHTWCLLRLYRETITQRVTNVTKDLWVFQKRGLHPLQPNAISPSDSVMII